MHIEIFLYWFRFYFFLLKAKDLITRLLTVSPEDRLTVEQALCHPFMKLEPSIPTLNGSTPINDRNISVTTPLMNVKKRTMTEEKSSSSMNEEDNDHNYRSSSSPSKKIFKENENLNGKNVQRKVEPKEQNNTHRDEERDKENVIIVDKDRDNNDEFGGEPLNSIKKAKMYHDGMKGNQKYSHGIVDNDDDNNDGHNEDNDEEEDEEEENGIEDEDEIPLAKRSMRSTKRLRC